jgi:hypothetical protein
MVLSKADPDPLRSAWVLAGSRGRLAPPRLLQAPLARASSGLRSVASGKRCRVRLAGGQITNQPHGAKKSPVQSMQLSQRLGIRGATGEWQR